MLPRILLCTTDLLLAKDLPQRMSSRTRAGGLDRAALWREFAEHPADLVVVDRRLLGIRPERQVRELIQLPGAPSVVVLIAEEESSARAALLAAGCTAVLSRGTEPKELALALDALAHREADRRRDELLPHSSEASSLATLGSKSPRMLDFLDLVKKIAPADSSLLLLGETGVGKEHFARAIHLAGPRGGGPFVPLHCAALSESLLESELFGHVEGAFTGALRYRRGVFELAHGGTIFLDEVGELSPQLQVKLLRVLQEKSFQPVGGEETIEVDIRLMAATNRDLHEEMSMGRFRPDLYYRLGVVSLLVPPLRDRIEDIPELAQRMIASDEMARKRGVSAVSAEGLDAMQAYAWPGNVRELMNVVERAALLTANREIQPSDLPFTTSTAPLGQGLTASSSAHDPKYQAKGLALAREKLIDEFEREFLDCALKRARGHLARTAEITKLNPRTLYAKMRQLGLRKENYRFDELQ